MKRYIWAAVLGVCLSTGPAHAFQQNERGKAEANAKSVQGPSVVKPLDLSAGAKLDPNSGARLSIPGLGLLGVLPKLDFGLELLYGDAPVAAAPKEDPVEDTDGLSIRGTLKHRF